MDHLLYALAWLSFGAGHSALAALAVKRRLRPVLGRWYRLAYNVVAVVHIGAVLGFGWWIYTPHRALALPDGVVWPLRGMFVLGLILFLWALKGYDLGRLAGTHQLRHPDGPEDEPLRTEGFHRYVRHPLYAGAFLLLWGRIGSEFELATTVWASLYLVVGMVFEERKLLRIYGAAYAEYRRRVPAIVPWKGRAL